MIEKKFDNINLFIFPTREEMGKKAADDAEICINKLLKNKSEINCVFAAAPSQNDFLAELVTRNIEWNRINAFHMDEYVGFNIGHKNSFNYFLSNAIFSKVPFKSVNLIDGSKKDEDKRYASLLENINIDITFMGIGENGHIAFNDPWVADFKDKKSVKIVKLDETCRMQQVHDGCFATIDDVPKEALTLTIPKLFSSNHIFCIVPTEKKHEATIKTLKGEISETCPASILRLHEDAKMYIDEACAGNLV
ncbi:MAG: 6-phosphogluconolactonase [Spirochaetales bacterium]|nr:6-phosphogluconolactonase [Spirochaetales bacterium]